MVNKRLEELGVGLCKARLEKRNAKKEETDYKKDILDEFSKAKITNYDGEAVYLELKISPAYNVRMDIAIKYAKLDELERAGILTIGREKFEEYLKEKGIKLEPNEYLTARGSHETLEAKLK